MSTPSRFSIAALSALTACAPIEYVVLETDTDSADTEGDGEIIEGTDSAEESGGVSAGSSDSDAPDSDPPPEAACEDEAEWLEEFVIEHCGNCHANGADQGGLANIDDYDSLIDLGLIVPGDAAGSPLFARVEAGTMPPAGVMPRPSDTAIDRLGDYIDECGPSGPDLDCTDQSLSLIDSLELMIADLTTIDADDRQFIRYLSLTHLYNAGLCEDDLRTYRDATTKLINALSNEAQLARLVPIDTDATILRVDLRDYGWDLPVAGFSDKWEALVDASPYSVERLEDQAETVKQLSGTNIPMLAADAFIDIASQPPLYHDLVGIPETLQELQAQLGVNINNNIEDEEVARAGVLDSGVSTQNRIIERHDIPLASNRAFWISYDFEDDSNEAENIYASPLDFEEAGGEVIFSLPNGLHAYMLTDAAGNRLDVAPDAIVTDPSQDDDNVRNGVSCFGCHPHIIPAVDSVRDYVLNGVEFDAQTKDTVAALYLPQTSFDDVVAADTQTYQAAVTGLDINPGLEEEPVSDTFARFQFNVSIEVAAAELGIAPEVLLTQLGALDPALTPLASTGVKRNTWSSLFADTICRLNLGIADDPECE